jgi:hypothetical protein
MSLHASLHLGRQVASAEQHHHGLAFVSRRLLEESGERDASGAFDRPVSLPGPFHSVEDRLLGNKHALVNRRAR